MALLAPGSLPPENAFRQVGRQPADVASQLFGIQILRGAHGSSWEMIGSWGETAIIHHQLIGIL